MTTLVRVWDLWARPQSPLHSDFHPSLKNCCLFMLHLPLAQRGRIRWRVSRRVSHCETDECVLLKPQSELISAPHSHRSSQLVAAKTISVHLCANEWWVWRSMPIASHRLTLVESKPRRRKAGGTREYGAQCEREVWRINQKKGRRGQPRYPGFLSHL